MLVYFKVISLTILFAGLVINLKICFKLYHFEVVQIVIKYSDIKIMIIYRFHYIFYIISKAKTTVNFCKITKFINYSRVYYDNTNYNNNFNFIIVAVPYNLNIKDVN